MIGERNIYSVSDVNRYIKSLINNDPQLKFILIKGEISNFKNGANGHRYFSLKDKECTVSCAMFSTYANKLSFDPKDGDEVVVVCSVDVYPVRGTYQLVVYEMNPLGLGQMLIELEKLKKKLQAEGLFDVSRKREINIYPNNIGVITAPNGAAVKDIVTTIKRRYPICNIYIFPSQVQGVDAPKELLAAFLKSQEYDLDTLIIGRGGGASEDLSAFNDEKLVRAVATSKFPVITAVGHEIDVTLIDFVADKRASTPTAAAELATVDMREIQMKFESDLDMMKQAIYNKMDDMKEDVLSLKEDLKDVMEDKLEYLKLLLETKRKELTVLNPKQVLKRGYTMTLDEEGKVVNVDKALIGKKIKTISKDGTIYSTVDNVED